MKTNARVLKNVYSVNAWQYANQAHISAGQVNEFYIQIVNLNHSVALNEKSQAFPEAPIRIMVPDVAVVTATFEAIDELEQFDITATRPFVEDSSIFKFTIPADKVPNSGNLRVKITNGSVITVFTIKSAIAVEQTNLGMC